MEGAAAKATFALKAGEWFRRGRFARFSPEWQPSSRPSGRKSTYRPVQICEPSSRYRATTRFASLENQNPKTQPSGREMRKTCEPKLRPEQTNASENQLLIK